MNCQRAKTTRDDAWRLDGCQFQALFWPPTLKLTCCRLWHCEIRGNIRRMTDDLVCAFRVMGVDGQHLGVEQWIRDHSQRWQERFLLW
jgi:hypothetical protein